MNHHQKPAEMKKLIERINRFLISRYWHLFLNNSIKVLEKKSELTEEELYQLLKSLPGKADNVLIQLRKHSYDGKVNSSPEECFPLFGEVIVESDHRGKKTFDNIIEALIGDEYVDGKVSVLGEYVGLCDLGFTRTIRSSFWRVCWINRHKENPKQEEKMRVSLCRFSLSDVGMNIVCVQTLGWFTVGSGESWFGVEEEYIIKWAETKTPQPN